jgi:Multiubiquitin
VRTPANEKPNAGQKVEVAVEANHEEAGQKPKKTVTIIVDGTPHEVPRGDISYAQVVALAYPENPQGTFAIIYTRGKHEGVLPPGASVEVKEEMEFRVSRTGQS